MAYSGGNASDDGMLYFRKTWWRPFRNGCMNDLNETIFSYTGKMPQGVAHVTRRHGIVGVSDTYDDSDIEKLRMGLRSTEFRQTCYTWPPPKGFAAYLTFIKRILSY